MQARVEFSVVVFSVVVQFEFPQALSIWQTVGMVHIGKRIPKKGDIVSSHPLNATFIVATVDHAAKTVDIQPLKAGKTLNAVEKNVPWTTLTYIDELDESQNALRVVREATEDK
jgi:hypothetical protein